MAARADSGGADGPFAGRTLFLVGRIPGITRRRLEQLLRARGGRLAPRPGRRVDLIAVASSAVGRVLPDGSLRLPAGLPGDAPLLGEQDLRRGLGLAPPPAAVARGTTPEDLARLSGLGPRLVASLALFDVLEPVDGRYGYRDLVAAREAGRLLAQGVALGAVLAAAVALRRRGLRLGEARLAEGPQGELLRDLAGQLAELSGQLTMAPALESPGLDELVAAAEAAEEGGDLGRAENLYSTALRAEREDPVLPFNLGNVLDAQGRPAEAKAAWQIAIARDPAFAEAWYNLALAAEDEANWELAAAQYRRAAQARPDYADAHFNLGLLLTKLERCEEALACWDRFLALEPGSRQAAIARRAAALCRMRLQEQRRAGGDR
ncbi:MAG: tetratricopeptide repeat protein [Dongiaceae bacterium]